MDGQFPAVTISYNLRPGVALSEGVAAVERVSLPLLPDSVSAKSQGTAQAFQDSLKGMGWLLLLAIVVIYLVLGILYESFIHPLTILSGLPSAGFGGPVHPLVFGQPLDLYGFVGVIMLLGIVKKNAIMMLDFALEAQCHDPSRTPLDAITEGCHVRFRPIMMTTMAALMGALPSPSAWVPAPEARPSPGPGGGGRPVLLPAGDPVHHARVLRLYGRLLALAHPPLRTAFRGQPCRPCRA